MRFASFLLDKFGFYENVFFNFGRFVLGEMLKFLGCLLVALGAVLSIPMEMTTMRPEATTEDTSGRLLSLPDPVKCAQSEWSSSFQSHIVT